MKIKSTTVFIALVFIACSKDNTSNKLQSYNVSNIILAKSVPINDLGTDTYMGAVGGLYPAGANSPSGQYAIDLHNASVSIVPLDTFGRVSNTKGKVVFLSLGSSTGGNNMKTLKAKTQGNPLTNPKLLLISGNNGSGNGSLNSIQNINDPYWAHVAQVVKGNKSSYRQAQVIYLETDDSVKVFTWPERPIAVKNSIENCLRVIKQQFVNVKVVYVLGRTKTFGNLKLYNKEPAPYFFGWACKWAIEDQINGVPGTEYTGSNAVAPMITWGFYQWADSTPRKTDGFYWVQSSTRDNLHASYSWQDTLATRFQKFLLTDQYASIWYAAH
jgi:hypothetical protein